MATKKSAKKSANPAAKTSARKTTKAAAHPSADVGTKAAAKASAKKSGVVRAATGADPRATVAAIVAEFERRGSAKVRDDMQRRYGITATKAFGVPVAVIHTIVKPHRRDHALAGALWKTGIYEARLAAAFVGEPTKVTPAEMDAWRSEFDSWAVCDTMCFHLWDRCEHAFAKVKKWATLRDEFGRRAAFALMAGIAQHDEKASDDAFLECLPLAEAAATDARNFVWKGVSWALRGTGERNRVLHAAVLQIAERLIASDDASSRRVGKDVMRDLLRPIVQKRLDRRG